MDDLPVGERQRLEILKALYRGARILILDEPTAVLTPQETEQLFVTLRQLRARGTTILLITHKLKEIMALYRRGDGDARRRAWCSTAPTADTSIDALAQAMVGRRVQLGRADAAARAGVRRRRCCRPAACAGATALGVARLADVSLTLRAGEIVGIAGVSGNGQSELLDALSGLLVPRCRHAAGRRPHVHGRALARPGDRARARAWPTCPKTATGAAWCCRSPAWESAVLGYQQRCRAMAAAAGCSKARCWPTPCR